MKQKRKYSIRMRIVAIGLSCWLIPFLVVTAMLGNYIFSDQTGKWIQQEREQLRFNTRICGERLNNSIAASRDASYEGELKKQWRNIDSESTERFDNYLVLNKTLSYLTKKYQHDIEFQSTFFWYEANPGTLNAAVYNNTAGGSYHQVQTFWNHDFKTVQNYAETLDTSTGFLMMGNRIYMVRNLMDGYFNTFGTLAMRLNVEYLFGSLLQMPTGEKMVMQLDDILLSLEEDGSLTSQGGVYPEDFQPGAEWKDGVLQIREALKGNNYKLSVAVLISRKVVLEPIRGYLYLLAGMIVILIPLIGLLYGAIRKHIHTPVEELMWGAKKVEEGKLGFQLEYEPGSLEFKYLVDSFNRMSERLKYQFDHIYKEELALRDARIMALQSHINPHFMNNTLEIINWEARLQGNSKISKMIESLSVLMNAAMDRKRMPEVELSEEMEYVDAYLYIMRERLGNRLRVVEELPEELMKEKVPRLILQPVIENAIVHGVVPSGEGTVIIRGYKKEKYLYLTILNSGEMGKDEEEKVKRLLDPDYNTSKESAGNLGIANVNQRLRILYGEPCGLSITGTKDGQVCACLTIFVGVNAQ